MNKIFLSLILAFSTLVNINAQDESNMSSEPKFGIKVGYSSITLRVSLDGTSASDGVSGFYLGVFGEFNISEKLDFQPELDYANYSEEGESTGVLLLPLLAKYKPNNQLSLLVGPQLDYLMNKEDSEGLKRVGFGVALGASYYVTENVIIDARYTFGLSDRLDGNLEDFEDFDVKTKFNYFQIGMGYRF